METASEMNTAVDMDTTTISQRKIYDLMKYHILYASPGQASNKLVTIKKEETFEAGVLETTNLASENKKKLAQTLPDVPLQNIFKYLQLKDLTNIQYVCKHWYDVAQDRQLWKNKTYKMRDIPEEYETYKWQLVNAPMLQNFTISDIPEFMSRADYRKKGYVDYEILETLLCHQKDLRTLETYKIELDLLRRLVDKFPSIEDISIGLCNCSAVNILDTLQSCKNLNHFKIMFCLKDWPQIDKRATLKITELLNDSFVSLKSLNLSYFQKILTPENIIYILERKLNQIETLELTYSKDADYRILDFISRYPNLKLNLCIEKELNSPEEGLNLQFLMPLKSLSLRINDISVQKTDIFGMFPLHPFTLENLLLDEICMLNVESLSTSERNVKYYGSFSQKISTAFPNLRTLKFMFPKIYQNFNEELVYLADLPYLREISLFDANMCRYDGILNLSKCSTLQSLEICNLTLTLNCVNAISQCSELRYLTLRTSYLMKIEHAIMLPSLLRNLKIFGLFDCILDGNYLHEALLSIIETECNIRNINFLH